MKFSQLPLNPNILDALQDMRYDECTPIQEQAIPPLLQGRDLIGIAQTGTGKTAAYLLPIIHRLTEEEFPQGAINCIIMAPTRELAQQIDQAVDAMSYYVPISSVAVYGGNSRLRYEQEIRGLRLGADIVIATPGRLLSHLAVGNLNLSALSFFVLDEADRMLDMGFIDDIRQILRLLPENRQTLLFSATMPQEISLLANQMLHNPVRVQIALSQPVESVSQNAYICTEAQKTQILQALFTTDRPERTLVFASTKIKVKQLALALRRLGIPVAQMHSDLPQAERDSVMRDFRSGATPLLIATDIISRGIDIDDIRTVINYNVPRDVEDYVHRIGRTARAGHDGRAITLVAPDERRYFDNIERFLHRSLNRLPLPEGLEPQPQPSPRHNRRNRPYNASKQAQARNNSPRRPHNRRPQRRNKASSKD